MCCMTHVVVLKCVQKLFDSLSKWNLISLPLHVGQP